MSEKGRNRHDPDRLAVLDDELTFALRSLDDLEAEHALGQLSDEQFERLRADYTVRAADAARRQRREAQRRTLAAPRGRRSRLAAAGVLLLAAAVVAVSLGQGSHSRAAGQTITGDTAAAPAAATSDDPRTHDARAERLLTSGDLAGALKEYLAAAAVDPRDPEALSYAGWISFLGGSPDKALPLLDAAVRADPSYPDGHAFRGIVLLRAKHDAAGAATELRTYLRLVPSGEMSGQVRSVLAAIQNRRP